MTWDYLLSHCEKQDVGQGLQSDLTEPSKIETWMVMMSAQNRTLKKIDFNIRCLQAGKVLSFLFHFKKKLAINALAFPFRNCLGFLNNVDWF